jgi:hypothetical protein
MKPTGISRGRFYERRYLADLDWNGGRMPAGMQPWKASMSGLKRHGTLTRTLYGLPEITTGLGSSAVICTRPSPK